MQIFNQPDARLKISNLDQALQLARAGRGEVPPRTLARSTPIVGIRELPTREGLASVAGLARVLHDLANIEMQALELGLRTVVEFYDQDPKFLDELEALTREEALHLELCLNGLERIGYPWGSWPVHIQLWKSTEATDSILDRILIVHRYQEGGGLEAGATLLRKLTGVAPQDPLVREALNVLRSCVSTIFADELGHVQFGSRWYEHFFHRGGTDRLAATAEQDFAVRLQGLMDRMPVRRERLDFSLRQKAGFTALEFSALEKAQISPNAKNPRPAT